MEKKPPSAEQRTPLIRATFNHSEVLKAEWTAPRDLPRPPLKTKHPLVVNPAVVLSFPLAPHSNSPPPPPHSHPPHCKVFHLLPELQPMIPQRWKSTNLFRRRLSDLGPIPASSHTPTPHTPRTLYPQMVARLLQGNIISTLWSKATF